MVITNFQVRETSSVEINREGVLERGGKRGRERRGGQYRVSDD